jgi:hypothetical protein
MKLESGKTLNRSVFKAVLLTLAEQLIIASDFGQVINADKMRDAADKTLDIIRGDQELRLYDYTDDDIDRIIVYAMNGATGIARETIYRFNSSYVKTVNTLIRVYKLE